MVRDGETLVRETTYHRQGEGDNGIVARACDAAGSETGTEIGQVANTGASQPEASKDREG